MLAGVSEPPLVIQTEHLHDEPAQWLAERCRLEKAAPDSARFAELLPEARALVIRTYTRVDEALLDRAPRLRVVGRAGVGLDNVDTTACARRGVVVLSTPEANTQAVVEYVLALALRALRPAAPLEHALPTEAWNALRARAIAPRQLGDLTCGILGLGRIGSRVAGVLRALGARVIYHDLRDIEPAQHRGAEPVGPDRLLAESDLLSVHVDARPQNRHLIGAPALARMKPDSVLLNTSRGFVVDAHALRAHLVAHPAALALIDVHDPEPITPDSPLLGLPNARLYPHLAAATQTAHKNMSWVVRDVWRVLEQGPEGAG